MEHLRGLNEAQKRAALHTEGPLLIIAGAGAGKTKTIAHRIGNLVHAGVDPRSILAITFTNKAAAEMRERVHALLAATAGIETGRPHYELPTVKTFHSLGVQILKENARFLGLNRHFSILDDGESSTLIRESLNELDLDPKQFEPRRLRNLISRQKGDFVDAETFAAGAEGYFPKILAAVWRRYEEKLRAERAVDFDDLIIRSVRLLREREDVRRAYHERFSHLHIDEYQDTNAAQYELTKLLVGPGRNICVVGDSDQNIYGWRGANLKNLLNFEKDYPGAAVVLLEENYRSTGNILEAANEIIKKNTIRKDKTLFTRKPSGEKIGLYQAFDENDEAAFVAEKIREAREQGVPHERMAVLYRANFQSRAFEEALFNAGIPYQVLGTKFFERKEVKDVLSYIRLALDPTSPADIRRVLNVPARGLGKVALAKVLAGKASELPGAAGEKFKDFQKTIARLGERAATLAPSLLVKEAVRLSGMEQTLRGGTEEDAERLENIHELAALASRYDTLSKEEALPRFLEDAALFSDQDSLSEKREGVKLLTVHAAKGLEFSHVFIVGLEQDLFPHARAGEVKREKEDEEEERRLFYVAITRAESKLCLSYAMMRTIFGGKQVNTPSEFIFDIPADLLEEERREPAGKVIHLD